MWLSCDGNNIRSGNFPRRVSNHGFGDETKCPKQFHEPELDSCRQRLTVSRLVDGFFPLELICTTCQPLESRPLQRTFTTAWENIAYRITTTCSPRTYRPRPPG